MKTKKAGQYLESWRMRNPPPCLLTASLGEQKHDALLESFGHINVYGDHMINNTSAASIRNATNNNRLC